jgi:hypothetical protein
MTNRLPQRRRDVRSARAPVRRVAINIDHDGLDGSQCVQHANRGLAPIKLAWLIGRYRPDVLDDFSSACSSDQE